jgi:hypothetical protein
MVKRGIISISFNIINLLMLYFLIDAILDTEIDLLHPNKWLLFVGGSIIFSIWAITFSTKFEIKRKYIYVFLFLFSVGLVTLFSNQIVNYQQHLNFQKANQLVKDIRKGNDLNQEYYTLGLNIYHFEVQEKNDMVLGLIFKGKNGIYHRYDFKSNTWKYFD